MESLHTKSSPKLWLCPLTVGRHVYLGCTRTCIRARYVEIDLSSVGWDLGSKFPSPRLGLLKAL